MDNSKTQPVPATAERLIERLVQRIEGLEQRIRVLEQDNGEIISLLIAIKAGLEDCTGEPVGIEEEIEEESGEQQGGSLFLH